MSSSFHPYYKVFLSIFFFLLILVSTVFAFHSLFYSNYFTFWCITLFYYHLAFFLQLINSHFLTLWYITLFYYDFFFTTSFLSIVCDAKILSFASLSELVPAWMLKFPFLLGCQGLSSFVISWLEVISATPVLLCFLDAYDADYLDICDAELLSFCYWLM